MASLRRTNPIFPPLHRYCKQVPQEDNRLYQMMMSTQFGITPEPISTLTSKDDISNKQQGVDMLESQSNDIIEKFQPTSCWLSETINLGLEVFKGFISEVSGQKGIQKLLIWQLEQLSKFMPLNLIKT